MGRFFCAPEDHLQRFSEYSLAMVCDSFSKKPSIAVASQGFAKASEKGAGGPCVSVVLVRKWYKWVAKVLQ